MRELECGNPLDFFFQSDPYLSPGEPQKPEGGRAGPEGGVKSQPLELVGEVADASNKLSCSPRWSTSGFAHCLKSLPQQLARSWSARGGRAPLKRL